MITTLLTNGDSWTFGSEIACPEILVSPGEKGYGMANRYKKDMHDTFPVNDYYRIPKIWPTQLANQLKLKCENISWPARSNDTIYTSTIGWVLDYFSKGGKSEELYVVIGWSSPERKNVLVEDFDNSLYQFTFWPFQADDDSYYMVESAKKYFKFYVQHLMIEREFLTRYVEQNYMLHTFLQSHGIRHKFFNAFYLWNHDPIPVFNSQDVDLKNVIKEWDKVLPKGWHEVTWQPHQEIKRVLHMWENIPSSVFLDKDTLRSFKSYIDVAIEKSNRMINMHPSPDSHKAWADRLVSIIGHEIKKENHE